MSRVNSGINDELSGGEVLVPMFLATIDVEAKMFLDFLVSSLGLSVSLRVVCRGEIRLDSQLFEKSSHDAGCKLRTSVADELER